MSVVSNRGGFPHVFRATIATTGRKHRFPFMAKFLKIRAATNPCKVYFTEADFDAGTNYISVPVAAAETPYGEWEGPAEVAQVWLAGDSGNSVIELVAFECRG